MKGLFAGAAIAAMLLASLPASAAEWNTILLEKVVNREAMANPACLAWYEDLARARLQSAAPSVD